MRDRGEEATASNEGGEFSWKGCQRKKAPANPDGRPEEERVILIESLSTKKHLRDICPKRRESWTRRQTVGDEGMSQVKKKSCPATLHLE